MLQHIYKLCFRQVLRRSCLQTRWK